MWSLMNWLYIDLTSTVCVIENNLHRMLCTEPPGATWNHLLRSTRSQAAWFSRVVAFHRRSSCVYRFRTIRTASSQPVFPTAWGFSHVHNASNVTTPLDHVRVTERDSALPPERFPCGIYGVTRAVGDFQTA